jgi:hypothetical protein
MTVIIDGTNGITSPGGDSAAVDVETPKVKTSGNFTIATNSADRVTVTSAGDVGIGTTDPQSKLQVVGDQIVVSGATALGNLGIQIKGTAIDAIPAAQAQGYIATGSSSIGANGDLFIASRTSAATSIRFITGTTPAERARIDSSGNFLVGTTDGASAIGTAEGIQLRSSNLLGVTRAGATPLTLSRRTDNGTIAEFRRDTTAVGSISVTGSATAYNTSSDYRLKENVQPMTGALEKVAALNPVTYTWKTDGSAGQGFIAHELQEVCPDAVTGEKDAVDAEGNPQYQGVDTSFLVGILTAAIKEQQAIITDLKARIEVLEQA